MKGEELKRIDNNNNGELPKGSKIVITASGIANPQEVLDNTKIIMKSISKYAYTNNWPTDKEWKTILPKWFVDSMVLRSAEDRDKNKDLWHFESWIDNIRQRFWVYWSSKADKNSIQFVLEAVSIPYLHDTFVNILYSQGIPMKNISVEDDIY
jgi:hypothetical protein